MSASTLTAIEKPSRMYMPAEYVLTGRSMKLLELAELDDLVESAVDLALPQAVDRRAQVDVVAAGEVVVEAGPELEQRADAAADREPAGRSA